MDPVQALLDELLLKETKKMLVDLAINFSKDTQLEVVPHGTKTWPFEIIEENGLIPSSNPKLQTKRIHIPLIHFFGMYAGYNSEIDVFVYWQPEKEKK